MRPGQAGRQAAPATDAAVPGVALRPLVAQFVEEAGVQPRLALLARVVSARLPSIAAIVAGGAVEVPGEVDFHLDFGFPPKTSYACAFPSKPNAVFHSNRTAFFIETERGFS